jgi:hypothetical protein
MVVGGKLTFVTAALLALLGGFSESVLPSRTVMKRVGMGKKSEVLSRGPAAAKNFQDQARRTPTTKRALVGVLWHR